MTHNNTTYLHTKVTLQTITHIHVYTNRNNLEKVITLIHDIRNVTIR